jgi:membrane protein implicated in regulation of membrane protease activity
MGWNPVQISEVTSVGATAMAIGMVISMVISMKDISDVTMIAFGLACFFLSGVSICTWWTDGVGYWHFVIPVYLMMFGYPFFGPANRSRYTKAIQGKKELEGSHGIMMSLITQAAAIATFIAPGTIAHFILRTQEEVDTSSNKHALTTGSLYVPILSVIMYLGLLYNHYFIDLPTERRSMDGSDAAISETTTLLPPKQKRESRAPRTSIIDISDAFSVSSRTSRRLSVEIMGVSNPVDTKYEMELDEQLLVDKELWDELEAMDEMEN